MSDAFNHRKYLFCFRKKSRGTSPSLTNFWLSAKPIPSRPYPKSCTVVKLQDFYMFSYLSKQEVTRITLCSKI